MDNWIFMFEEAPGDQTHGKTLTTPLRSLFRIGYLRNIQSFLAHFKGPRLCFVQRKLHTLTHSSIIAMLLFHDNQLRAFVD